MQNRAKVNIHPTAIVHPLANLGRDTTVGPYCIIGKDVTIGTHCEIKSHVNIEGKTTLGNYCQVFPFASLGTIPQDLKYHGEQTKLIIGNHNTIREHVTMNTGTAGDHGITQVGDHGLFMIGSHIAHDCVIGNHVIMANNASLAGHVTIEDYAILGGLTAIHQFTRLGEHCMIGGGGIVARDVIPFSIVKGNRAQLAGLNLVGLKRRGFDRHHVADLRQAFKLLFQGNGDFEERVSQTASLFPDSPLVNRLIAFITADSKRQLITNYTKKETNPA